MTSGGYREEGKEGERRGMSDGKIERRVVYPVCVCVCGMCVCIYIHYGLLTSLFLCLFLCLFPSVLIPCRVVLDKVPPSPPLWRGMI